MPPDSTHVDEEGVLTMKPQNLLFNLPLARPLESVQ